MIVNKNGVFIDTHVRYRTISDNLSKQEYKFLLTTTLTISGTEKLPNWIREYTGKQPDFHFTSGTEFPEDVSGYKLIVHCGGCMLNERKMRSRLRSAADQEIPMTNYGIAIAYIKGILERSIEHLLI